MTTPNNGMIWDPATGTPGPSEFGGEDGWDLGATKRGLNPLPGLQEEETLHAAYRTEPADVE